jgi:hypothetical protein
MTEANSGSKQKNWKRKIQNGRTKNVYKDQYNKYKHNKKENADSLFGAFAHS